MAEKITMNQIHQRALVRASRVGRRISPALEKEAFELLVRGREKSVRGPIRNDTSLGLRKEMMKKTALFPPPFYRSLSDK